MDKTNKNLEKIYGLVYCRVSSDRQMNEGGGLGSQEQRCREYAKNNNIEVEGIFTDHVSGGGSYKTRPGQVKLIKWVDDHPHKKYAFIVDDISRLARDVAGHLEFIALLKKRSVDIKSPNFNFEDTPEGNVIQIVMASFSEYHRHVNKRQVVQKQKARLMQGLWPFPPRRGYIHIKTKEYGLRLEPKEPEASLIKTIFERFANGKYKTKVECAKFLCEKGFWGKKHQSPEKYIDKVRAILTEPLYAGFIEKLAWDVPRIDGKHKAVVAPETFEQVQKNLNREEKGTRIRKDVSEDFPLRGLVVCYDCGRPFTAAWSTGRTEKYGYYFCQNSTCPARRKSIRREIFETEFKIMLGQSTVSDKVIFLLNFWFKKAFPKMKQEHEKRGKEILREVKNKNKQIDDLVDLIPKASNESSKKRYEQKIETIEKEIETLSNELKLEAEPIPYRTALDTWIKFYKNPVIAWEVSDIKEKQEFFYGMFNEKIPFQVGKGYRTEKIPSKTMYFSKIEARDLSDVELAEIESACKEEYICLLHV